MAGGGLYSPADCRPTSERGAGGGAGRQTGSGRGRLRRLRRVGSLTPPGRRRQQRGQRRKSCCAASSLRQARPMVRCGSGCGEADQRQPRIGDDAGVDGHLRHQGDPLPGRDQLHDGGKAGGAERCAAGAGRCGGTPPAPGRAGSGRPRAATARRPRSSSGRARRPPRVRRAGRRGEQEVVVEGGGLGELVVVERQADDDGIESAGGEFADESVGDRLAHIRLRSRKALRHAREQPRQQVRRDRGNDAEVDRRRRGRRRVRAPVPAGRGPPPECRRCRSATSRPRSVRFGAGRGRARPAGRRARPQGRGAASRAPAGRCRRPRAARPK